MKDKDKVEKFLSFCIKFFSELKDMAKGDIMKIEWGGRRFAIVSLDERRKEDDDSDAFEEFTG